MISPTIGITVDNRDNRASSGRYESSIAYSRAVADAGGVPVLLPHEVGLIDRYVALCDGFVLTGGVDPRTEAFGEPTHPRARPMDADRQEFELALLAALDEQFFEPVLGICLGMQLMALHHGGKLNQYLPDTLDHPELHSNSTPHPVQLTTDDSPLHPNQKSKIKNQKFPVVSHHQQAVSDPGSLRIIAEAPDGVIEAIDNPARPFYLGVQWHPERAGPDDGHQVNQGLFDQLVRTAANAT